MITSTGNARIKAAKKLHQKRHREEQDRLLLEGVRLIGDAVQSGARPIELFYAPALTQTNPLADALLAQLSASGVPCLECAPEVITALGETVTTQGVVAVLSLPHLAPPAQPTLTLVLDQVREPGNVPPQMLPHRPMNPVVFQFQNAPLINAQ
jgi:TrmH family RNA methyltransferase